nr:hypothetical protein [Serratia fonticola]
MNTPTLLSHTDVKTTPLRTDGFVRNLSSRHPFDVIRVDVVFASDELLAELRADY